MDRLRPVVVASAITLSLVGVGRAADVSTMPPPISMSPRVAPEYAVRNVFDSGWYLRGDVGYAWGKIDSAQSAPGFASPSTSSLGNAMTGGIGAGIKSKWLRTDITFDYATPMKYKGTIATAGDVTAKMATWSFLFNGYLDLGNWYRATPYIGGGIGAVRVATTDYESTVAPPFIGGLTNNQWNFAWAAMAGVGYAVSPNVIVDLGYRYINFGDVKSAADAAGSMSFKNLAAHEVRVGFRWSIDDLPAAH